MVAEYDGWYRVVCERRSSEQGSDTSLAAIFVAMFVARDSLG
jgi:hypothetical protein